MLFLAHPCGALIISDPGLNAISMGVQPFADRFTYTLFCAELVGRRRRGPESAGNAGTQAT